MWQARQVPSVLEEWSKVSWRGRSGQHVPEVEAPLSTEEGAVPAQVQLEMEQKLCRGGEGVMLSECWVLFA